MKLLDLHIDGFGKFHNCDISFQDGMNIVYGKNEAGKSTLHTFIRAMLFGLERGRGRASRNDLYSKYEPWNKNSGYGGRLRLEQGGQVYRIERHFRKTDRQLVIVNETMGREEIPTKILMDRLRSGLSETAYVNTISIGQLKSATDSGMVTELKNYIANMNTTGDMALNITKATDFLKKQRREFERQMVPEATKHYTQLLGEIRGIEREIASPEYENQLSTYQTMRQQVKKQLDTKQTEREVLLRKVAKGQQLLASNQFTDEASITSYQNETRSTYEEYLLSKVHSERGIGAAGAVFSLIIAAVLGAAAAACYLNPTGVRALFSQYIEGWSEQFSLAPLVSVLGVGAAVFLLLGVGVLLRRSGLKKRMEYSLKLLQEIFSKHLGDASVSPEAMKAFDSRMEEFSRLTKVLGRSEVSLEEYAKEIAQLKTRQDNCQEEIEKQQKSQWELEKKLEQLSGCKEEAESYRSVLSENERLREEIDAIDLALDTMTGLSSSIRGSFGLYLNKRVSDLIDGITGGIYNSISVDENLNVFMNTSTKLVPLEQVSSGTMDQVYLALRLAAVQLIQSGEDELPLIFDDSFVLYDDGRLRTALQWLTKTYPGQIIMFTCHKREAQMLTACQVEYHLIEM